MQASTTVITVEPPSITQRRDAGLLPPQRPSATLQTTKRAETMTVPALSLSIPNTQLSEDGTTTKYIIKDGNVVAQDEVESEAESGRSSICHSPSWDDVTAKRKRKEKQEAEKKRKMEKKKFETEAKHAQKMKNRLSKPPPTNKRLSKMVFPPDRSISTPTIPTLPETKEESKKTPSVHSRTSRRGSMDMGFKSLFLWKSSTTPTETTPTKGRSPSRESGGFIGGLKLRLSEEATVQERVWKPSSVTDDQRVLPMEQTKTPNSSIVTSIKGTSGEESKRQTVVQTASTSVYEELVRTPEQWDARAGKMVREVESSQPAAEDVPIKQRNIKKGRKARPSINDYFSSESTTPPEGFSQRESSSSSKLRPSEASGQPTGGDWNDRGQRPSLTPSDKQTLQSRNRPGARPETADSGYSGSYVQNQRRQSQDVAVAAFKDQYRVSTANAPEKSPRCSPESFHSVKSHASTEAPAASDPRVRIDDAHPFFKEDYVPPQLNFDNLPTTSPSIAESHERKSLKGLKGLKDVARAAFSRQSAPGSPVDNDLVNPDIIKALTVPRRPAANRATIFGVPERISGQASKSENVLREPLHRSPHATRPPNFSAHPSNRPPISDRNSNRDSSPAALQNKSHNVRTSRGWPSTDSSEEYSTLGECSNVTTPIASRPTSQKDQPPELKLGTNGYSSASGSISTLPRNGKNAPIMCRAAPYDQTLNGSGDGWSRTAMEISLTDDEERLKTPKASQERSILAKPDEVSRVEINAGLNRQPSISRSFSTPDLSFLPALKHESLTRGPNPKGKDSASNNDNYAPAPTTLIKPPQATKAEGSSPISPTRLHPTLPNPNPTLPNPQPIAKMFVECCSCHYLHDMPSKIYSCMASPASVVEDRERGVHGVVSTSVKCPWCGHGMSTGCCGGWAAVVYLREKLH
jgi:hypothetical protein